MSKFTGQGSRPNSILFWVLLLVAPGRSLAGESDLVHFTLADMDGDRDRDVVVARDGTISVLLNSGNASLMATAPISATQVSRVAAGDINGDGLPDVASLQQNLGTLVVHLNSGNGQIASGTSFVVGGDPSAIALIDLDRDRDLDIAVTRRAAGDVFLWFNDGTSLFPLSATVTVGATPHLLLPSDIDRDGFPDLVVFHDTQPPR
ncbi:MAG: VCBS repeat-containing protein, partial [Candidatus Omnitrophica bacterium]|nr:VCBS repeat-containing protein [Candidatus Omnitrophota bacterium]